MSLSSMFWISLNHLTKIQIYNYINKRNLAKHSLMYHGDHDAEQWDLNRRGGKDCLALSVVHCFVVLVPERVCKAA